MTQLVWFRNDLRAADNPALAAACQSAAQSSGELVAACFIITTEQWLSHDWSAAKVSLMLDHADALAQELAKLGIALSFCAPQTLSNHWARWKFLPRAQD